MSGVTPTVKRCPETRAHYAHEWYSPFRLQCPGGPEEAVVPREEAHGDVARWRQWIARQKGRRL